MHVRLNPIFSTFFRRYAMATLNPAFVWKSVFFVGEPVGREKGGKGGGKICLETHIASFHAAYLPIKAKERGGENLSLHVMTLSLFF